MLQTQLCKDSSGNTLSVYNIGTITTITTKPIDTSRCTGKCGLLFVIAGGTVATLTREVSVDESNWYSVYDSNGTNLSSISATVPNSRLININEVGSGGIVSPWTRFKFVGTGTITTLSLYYIGEEL